MTRPGIRRLAMFACALVSLAVAGCGADAPASSRAVVRDSAGIEIVESGSAAWGEADAWTLSGAPILEIGVREGAPAYQLYRAWDAARLSDGRIVVANAGTQELRYYDADGRHLRSVGGEGEGPGEFMGLRALVRLPGDSVLACDGSLRRLSIFDPSGAYVRSARLDPPGEGAFAFVLGGLGDGSMLVRATHTYRAGAEASGARREPFLFLRYTATGEILDTIGRFPGVELYVRSDAQGISVSSLPFGRSTYAAASAERVFVGTSDRPEVRVLNPAGELVRLIRRKVPLRPVTEEAIDAYVEGLLARIEDANGRRRAERAVRSFPLPETMPAYDRLLADREGTLWVRRFAPPGGQEGPSLWAVFDRQGVLQGEVAMPAGFTPRAIGSDYVLGSWEDALEVEYIRLYAIRKP